MLEVPDDPALLFFKAVYETVTCIVLLKSLHTASAISIGEHLGCKIRCMSLGLIHRTWESQCCTLPKKVQDVHQSCVIELRVRVHA